VSLSVSAKSPRVAGHRLAHGLIRRKHGARVWRTGWQKGPDQPGSRTTRRARPRRQSSDPSLLIERAQGGRLPNLLSHRDLYLVAADTRRRTRDGRDIRRGCP
jgi:hypothetical protein